MPLLYTGNPVVHTTGRSELADPCATVTDVPPANTGAWGLSTVTLTGTLTSGTFSTLAVTVSDETPAGSPVREIVFPLMLAEPPDGVFTENVINPAILTGTAVSDKVCPRHNGVFPRMVNPAGGAGLTLITSDVLTKAPEGSVALTVVVNVPSMVGEPEMIPSPAPIVNPGGRLVAVYVSTPLSGS